MMAFVIVATVKGVTEQMDEIGESATSAIQTVAEQTEDIEVDEAALEDARAAINDASPTVESGVLAGIVEGIDGLIAIAGGVILGALIMYYLLKDGASLRRSVVGQVDASYRDQVNGFIGDACRILRDYGKGRTIMSAIVATAVGLAALIMGLPLVLSIVGRELRRVATSPTSARSSAAGWRSSSPSARAGSPRARSCSSSYSSRTSPSRTSSSRRSWAAPSTSIRWSSSWSPRWVACWAASSGLILAVPAWVIAGNAFSRLRSGGLIDAAVEKAQPAVQQLLDD